MPEHVHLLIIEPEIESPSKVMQVLKHRTARACWGNASGGILVSAISLATNFGREHVASAFCD